MSHASDLTVRRKAMSFESLLLTSLLDVKHELCDHASDLAIRRKA
jgi:hypothetical protein